MSALPRRRSRAPSEDGAALVDPPLWESEGLVEKNRNLSGDWKYDCQGRRLESMVFEARGDLLAAAMTFTAPYANVGFVPALTYSRPFILAGHQPELFHPGVWFKNFLLSALGRKKRAVAINLIVDTDQVRRASIAVPSRDGQQAEVFHEAYDASGEPVPYEERRILDSWLFESFRERVHATYDSCRVDGREPYPLLVDELWEDATSAAAARQGDQARLGLVLAEARHVIESRFGLTTLEVPLSTVAQLQAFRWFTAHLLVQLPRLWRVYNSALAEYRHANGIRSSTHPVPSLQEHDDWLEAPFFVWTTSDPRRRHLFVQQHRSSLVLSDRQGLRLPLDIAAEGPPDKAIEQLATAEARGIKVRPRALMTTMYARLVLSDLFIHGIGGAKYDELTDLIIRRFFGIEPPTYVTATATFRLPIERPEVSIEDVQRVATRIREARYGPEAFLKDERVGQDASLASKLAELAAEKRDYLDKHDLRRCPPEVFERLDRMNRAMHDLLKPVKEELRSQHAELTEQFKQARLLGSREFSFVLYPSEILPARLLDFCKVLS